MQYRAQEVFAVNTLQHHGVQGMKWGVRKDRQTLGKRLTSGVHKGAAAIKNRFDNRKTATTKRAMEDAKREYKKAYKERGKKLDALTEEYLNKVQDDKFMDNLTEEQYWKFENEYAAKERAIERDPSFVKREKAYQDAVKAYEKARRPGDIAGTIVGTTLGLIFTMKAMEAASRIK